ncbi:hypothetical protein JTB14_032383 [Gonioctena quinquepunctata]|nr:hypothetical protein JTB14_032383 [Gonioctena quinquepunctata]
MWKRLEKISVSEKINTVQRLVTRSPISDGTGPKACIVLTAVEFLCSTKCAKPPAAPPLFRSTIIPAESPPFAPALPPEDTLLGKPVLSSCCMSRTAFKESTLAEATRSKPLWKDGDLGMPKGLVSRPPIT